MRFTAPRLTVGVLLGVVTFNATASLTVSTVDGNNLVYSGVSNITWTGDANLFNTLVAGYGYSDMVDAIIGASPTVTYDFYQDSGTHSVTTSDFDENGKVNWFGAKAFANYLNHIKYAGSNQWILPTSAQFGELIFSELGSVGYHNIPNSEYFANEQSMYWSATTAGPNYSWPYSPQSLNFNYGALALNVWAVNANLTAVPLPGAVWFFAGGLLGVFARGWRRS